MDRKEIINALINLFILLLDSKEKEFNVSSCNNSDAQTVEMLTIPECLKTVSGVSESTLRKLIMQGEIPFIRAGEGKNGKILVNKATLIDYFNIKSA